MSLIWTEEGHFRKTDFDDESELETAILRVQDSLFGSDRIYLDIKKKIGAKGGIRNIPDGYLIDLSSNKPRLYVIENELASHDPLRHIAVQILQFSLSFETEQHTIKKFLFNALNDQPKAKEMCEVYAAKHEFRNLDHLLEYLVFEAPFAALVVIDEIPENLENVLARKFQFGVEVLELSRYENDKGKKAYSFTPFLADVDTVVRTTSVTKTPVSTRLDISEIDTVVVPSWEEGFQQTFIAENRWYAIRIHSTIRPQLKYIAVYRVAPISAITHIAQIKSIEPWRDTGKFVVNFTEAAREIGPIPLVKGGRIKPLYNLRYTMLKKIEVAKNLDDIW